MLFAISVHAQEWKENYTQGAAAYQSGEFQEAFRLSETALNQYRAGGGEANANMAAILRLLSNICYADGRYNEGLNFIEKELAIREIKKDTTYATALLNQALFFRQLGSHAHAIDVLQRVEKIFSEFYPADDPRLTDVAINLAINYYLHSDLPGAANIYNKILSALDNEKVDLDDRLEAYYYYGLLQMDAGKSEAAITSFISTRDLYQKAGLQESANYALVLMGLGQAYQQSNQHAAAEETYRKAQEIYEKAQSKDNDYFQIISARVSNFQKEGKFTEAEQLLAILKETPEAKTTYALSLTNTAAIYQAQGEYPKSEVLYLEALTYFQSDEKEALLQQVTILQNLGVMYSDKGDQEQALSKLQDARTKAERLFGLYDQAYLAVLNKLGVALTRAGRTDEATQVYVQINEISKKLLSPPTRQLFMAELGEAALAIRLGQYAKADSIYGNMVTMHYAVPGQYDNYYLTILNSLAASLQAQGKLAASREMMSRVVATTRSLHGRSSLHYGQALENIALLRMRLGDNSPVKAELDSALTIYKNTRGENSIVYAQGLMSMGRYLQVTGDYTAAEPYLKNGRDILKRTAGEESALYATSLNALALLYQTLGNYSDAGSLLTEARTLFEKRYGVWNAEYSTATQNLAALYQLEGELQKAEPLLRQAIDIDRKVSGENNPQFAILLQNMATLYQKLGQRDEAEKTLNQALELTRRTLGSSHPSYATTLANLAALYQDKNDFVQAEKTWVESVELRKKVLGENHPDYARSLFGLAGVYHAQGQWEKARTYYEPVVADYQKQVKTFFPALSEKEKGAFYAKIKPVFDAYQDFCVQYLTAFPEKKSDMLIRLYDLQLSTKAILLNASNKVRSRILASGDPELKQGFAEWLALKEELVRVYNYTREERDRLSVDLPALETRANDLEKTLSQKSDAFKSGFDKAEIHWSEVVRSLQPGEACVEILRVKKKYTTDSVYYLGLVLKGGDQAPDFLIWPKGNRLESRLFKFHRNTIKFHLRDTNSYVHFWQPLNERIAGTKTLYLSCDGVFNKVNFNSLFNASTHRWVIDDYTIRLLSNTRELAEDRRAVSYTKRAAVFGFADFNLDLPNRTEAVTKRAHAYGFEEGDIPVLPATEREIDEIGKILQANSWEPHLFKKMEATEENMKRVDGAEVIHIATHGFFLSDVDQKEGEENELQSNPLFRSGVLLAGAGVDRSSRQSEEDGVLTAYEAMNLNLEKTDLVVLSACETGLGEIRNGEGVYGLQRSFLVAGANSVLMSLWQVDDVATQELMNSFYTFWLGGQERNEAFRNAQLAMKEKYDAPYFWGAFVLIGL
ncbi:MAG TPA: CHAT domain-containing protein [Cyclobacteriaceae bacterium]|nr:CHAT domain-containing protein [Cyclobacteriaceae bacterium]